MENNEKLREISIKNRTFYYFDGKIKIEDFDFDNILLDEKSYGNIFIYDIWYKTLIGTKPLHIRFDKEDGFIRVYHETRYLLLFGGEKHDFIYNRIRYLIGVKNGVTYVCSHIYAKDKPDSYDSLPLEKKIDFA